MPSCAENVLKLQDTKELVKLSKEEFKQYLVQMAGYKEPLAYYSFIKACHIKKYNDLVHGIFDNTDKTELRSSFANIRKRDQWKKYLLGVTQRITSIKNMILLTMGSYNAKYNITEKHLHLDELSELARWTNAGGNSKDFFNITFDRVAHQANKDLGLGNNYLGDFWNVTKNGNEQMIKDLSKRINNKALIVHMDTQQKVSSKLAGNSLRTMVYLLDKYPNNTILFALNTVLHMGGTIGTYKPLAAYWYFRNFFHCLKSRGMKMLRYMDSTTNPVKTRSEMGCFYFLFKR